ncbi:DUF1287 domain-containing protein [Falsibacillus albus]|uniref:DUF1287 domain-containing protein n=1 Tax=Falsibacillus albus TaxID=2478915 RepID=A0A3L7K455_9BACI|nr:DUF1287 domain-containing protein [Falsibacillus albus]RLQ97425.1 DUF1287 domain-containing protein [Falsibacillus albus]
MKVIKKLSILVIGIAVLLVLLTGYLYYFRGYHGSMYTSAASAKMKKDYRVTSSGDANGNGVSNIKEISANGVKLAGTLYDPLKGSINNTGGKMGFIVCIDVPRIAYGQAGISLADMLESDYEEHPEHYETAGGSNTPDTPYFFRRVRNVYDFAKGNGMLVQKAEEPKIGDIVFYGRYHSTLVVGVHDDGTYDEVEAHPKLVFVQEHKRKKWIPHDVARILE